MTTFDEKIWFYLDDQNQQKGPFSEQDIQGFYQQGILIAESFVWKSGLENWQSLSTALPHLAASRPSVLSFDREPAPAREPSAFPAQANSALHKAQHERVGQARKLTTKEILFSFEGRLPRKPFWLTNLFIVLAFVIIGILFAIVVPSKQDSAGIGFGIFLVVIGLPALVILVWAGIAMGVKRLHDQNLTGWFYLISFIPYIGSLILLVMYCIKGTDGTNQYGEDTRHLY